jgi:hypothetical protein
MDKKTEIRCGNILEDGIGRNLDGTTPAVLVSGLGWEISPDAWQYLIGNRPDPSHLQLTHDCDPTGYLGVPKTIKYMSKQDRLAVNASGKALEGAGHDLEKVKDSCGLFMTVGYIPFKREEAERICHYSQENHQFSMSRFSTEAYDSINPLLAFACLPNMPAYHLSANFNIQGEYFLTYPGAVQFYQVLSEAVQRLQNGDVERAIVGGVSDQCNFLVENHFQKFHAGEEMRTADVAAFLILERMTPALTASRQARIKLLSLDTQYTKGDEVPEQTLPKFRLGPAELPMLLNAFAHNQKGLFSHCCRSETHTFKSTWEVL